MAKAVADETFVKSMEKRGSVIRLMSPEETGEFIEGQYNTFRALVDKLGMRVEG
ncbi:hypothetical protein ACM25N_00115 [Roseovarius sp. C7]|uniref:hypothetical protein n=1 Tax=Roseovarius sp. C7 TaxID=3398643 RepID=UPI0039F57F27